MYACAHIPCFCMRVRFANDAAVSVRRKRKLLIFVWVYHHQAFQHWRRELGKIHAADELYRQSVTRHLQHTLQVWHQWATKQRQCRETEVVLTKQWQHRVVSESMQRWKVEMEKVKRAKRMYQQHLIRW